MAISFIGINFTQLHDPTLYWVGLILLEFWSFRSEINFSISNSFDIWQKITLSLWNNNYFERQTIQINFVSKDRKTTLFRLFSKCLDFHFCWLFFSYFIIFIPFKQLYHLLNLLQNEFIQLSLPLFHSLFLLKLNPLI